MSDISKLPKWAQRRIETAERDVEYWKARYHQGPEESDTFIETYEGKGRPLGRGAQIRYDLPNGARVEVSLRRGALTIYSVGVNGMDSLSIRPNSSNSVTIEVPER